MEATNRVVLLLSGPLTRADGPRLCAELTASVLAHRDTGPPRCAGGDGGTEVELRIGRRVRSDLATVDVLARLRLAARRQGCTVRVAGAPRELLDLLRTLGLDCLADDPSPTG